MALTKLNTRSLQDNAITTAKIATSVATDYSTISSDGHIQTVTAKLIPTIVAITTDAEAATGLQCDITPKLANSKIVLQLGGGQQTYGQSGRDMVAAWYGSFPSTATPTFLKYLGGINQTSNYHGSWSGLWMHNPSYTVGQTLRYYIYCRNRGGSGTVYFHYNTGGIAGDIGFTVTEIKA